MDAEKERKAIDRLRAFVPPDGEHVLRWWVGDDPMQLSFFDGEE